MKLRSKIIIFVLVVLFAAGFLFFWWRSLRRDSGAEGGPGSSGATSSAFQFSEVPRASNSLFSPDSGNAPAETGAPTPSPQSGGGLQFTFTRLSDQAAFAHWAIQDTGEVFYMTPNGKVFSAEEGDDIEISPQELPSPLRRAEPSPNGRLVLGLFGTKENPRWGMYDTIDGVWRPLPAGILDAAWGATSETLLTRMAEGGALQFGTINLSDSALRFTPLLQDFRLKNVSMHALSADRILLVENPAPGARSKVWEFNPKTLALKTISAAEEGVLLRVSPRRDLILKYASPDAFQVLDKNFEEQAPLFFLTLPQKCGFEDDSIFCFRPQEDFSDQPAFFDDYFKKRVFTTDSLVIFGPTSFGEDTLFVSGEDGNPPIDGIYPMFAKDRYTFLNRYDGYVYQLTR